MSKGTAHRLTLEERQAIEQGIKENLSFSAIARLIGREPTSIGKEVKKNGGREFYSAKKAHDAFSNHRRSSGTYYTLEERKVIEKLYAEGTTHVNIAKAIGRSQTGVSREIARNIQIDGCYIAEVADSRRMNPHEVRWENNVHVNTRLDNIELQIEIILDQLKELKCQKY